MYKCVNLDIKLSSGLVSLYIVHDCLLSYESCVFSGLVIIIWKKKLTEWMKIIYIHQRWSSSCDATINMWYIGHLGIIFVQPNNVNKYEVV